MKNNRGFGTLAIVLIIVVLGVIGAVGFYVYQHNKTKDNSYQASTQQDTKESSKANDAPAQTDTKPQASQTTKYTQIKELGVELVLPASLKDFTFTIKNLTNANYQEEAVAYLESQQLTDMINKCNSPTSITGKANFAAISNSKGTYPKNPTIDDGNLLKQFDTSYVTISVPNGAPCSDATDNQPIYAFMKTLQNDFVAAFKQTGREIK